jgi:hypothetical protein
VQNGELAEYRQHLILAEQKAQEDYDKTVLSLAGGALGISFAFVDKFMSGGAASRPGFLVAAWSCWGLSLGCVLVSYFLSRNALRTAIQQTDAGKIRRLSPGGAWSVVLEICNVASGVAFVLGVILIVLFVWFNMEV